MDNLPSEIFMLANEPVLISRGGNVRFANAAAVRLLGDDCVGRSVRKLFGEDIAEVQTKIYIANVPVNGKNLTLRIIKHNNETVIYITDPVPAVDMINDAFLYSTRGELMNISIAAQLLRERTSQSCTPVEQQSLASIGRSYYVLQRLMKNISVVTGANNGTLAYLPFNIDISAICGDMARLINDLFKDTEIKLNIGGKHMLYADPELLKLLIGNLLSNCLHHAKGLSCISMSLLDCKESIVLSVSDDGCGIKAGEMSTVFERYRYNSNLKNLSSGAGLGLSVVKSIATMHGGTLLLESRENVGTTVRVSFRKSTPPISIAQAPQVEYGSLLEGMITSLADVLPQESFHEAYFS